MLNCILTWLYNLVVESHVIYHLLSFTGPLFDRYSAYICKKKGTDHVTDDSGCRLKVTKWNGRNVSPFPLQRYNSVKDICVRKSDVYLTGYPKTGCHWTFEILFMLTRNKAEPSRHGSYYEGMFGALPQVFLDSIPSPRIMNSHFLYEELPTGVRKHKNKIVLTIRCPKDTVVSFYHHTHTLPHWFYGYDGNFNDYFNLFMKGEVDYGDYFKFYLSWANAIKEQRDNPIFFLEFEELKENPVQKVMELANFLEIAITEEFAEKVVDASSFSRLKKTTKSVLFRKGAVGDWKSTLTEKQAARVDERWKQEMVGFQLPSGKIRYCD